MLPLKTYIRKPSLITEGLMLRIFKFLEPFLSDTAFLKMVYPHYIGEKLDLDNPTTFNAKIQWLKLNYYDSRFPKLVDKASVKQYVASVIGEEYIIPTIGVWDSFDDIDFDSLPDGFVIKTTNGGGGDGVVVVKDKSTFDKASARKKINTNLKLDISKYYKEWPYKDVPRRIIVEELIPVPDGVELLDYKLLSFNGTVRCSYVGSNRFREGGVHYTYYDREWKRLPFEMLHHEGPSEFPKPKYYDEMIRLAEKLSVDIPFVRVDFYEANDKIYFGEMTFFTGSGFLAFSPKEWDAIVGSWLTLPDKNN